MAIDAALRAVRQDHDEVTFVGGEPTLHPAIVSFVARARQLGFAAVGVQSHGRRLDRAVLGALERAGLSDLHLSIHGPTAAIHDHHVGVAGALDQVTAALGAARRLGLRAVALTVLSRSNFRHLAAMPTWLLGQSVSAWTIAVPRAAGRALLAFESVYPRLGMALPHALRALEIAVRQGLPAWISGAPRCLLGPYGGRELGDDARGFAPCCAGCPARGGCPGVDPVYLGRFAGDELSPAHLRPEKATRAFVDEAALRRIFVGAGALAHDLRPLPSIVAPPRSAAARALLRPREEPDR